MSLGRTVTGLYAILDADAVALRELDLLETARALRRAGVTLLQYRDKTSDLESLVQTAREIRAIFAGAQTTLLLNDHAELVRECQFDGVHLGQDDLSPSLARGMLGEGALIGLSTHNLRQALEAEDQNSVDYIALGPIFATATKHNPEPTVGLDTLGIVRQRTRKPLVAIGGITAGQVNDVVAAGADAVAMIGALLTENIERTAAALIAICGPTSLFRSETT